MSQPAPQRSTTLWCPQQIDVIGGGLWSRVIVETLCGMLPPDVGIGIHSPRNYPLLRDWCARMGLASRVRITAAWPSLENSQPRALIVVNAARDHADAVERVLPSKIPTLVEKPFTVTAAETQRLIRLAAELEGSLAASHVFLFARYLQNFIAMLALEGPVQHLALRWGDPQAEMRHGDKKSYDPGLPLHIDVLPHISSVAEALLPGRLQSFTGISVLRGGAQLRLGLHIGDVPCSVDLARNAARRERVIEVTTARKKFTLDFTAEPRMINHDGTISSADPDWDTKERPLACMLRAFLSGANSGSFDARFSVAKALQGIALADQVTPSYRKTVNDWLVEALPRQAADSADGLRYALRELFHAGRRADASAVEARVVESLRALRGARAENVIDFIAQES